MLASEAGVKCNTNLRVQHLRAKCLGTHGVQMKSWGGEDGNFDKMYSISVPAVFSRKRWLCVHLGHLWCTHTRNQMKWLLCILSRSLWRGMKGLGRSTRSWNPDTCVQAEGTSPNVLMLGKICKYWTVRSVLEMKYWKLAKWSEVISLQLQFLLQTFML